MTCYSCYKDTIFPAISLQNGLPTLHLSDEPNLFFSIIIDFRFVLLQLKKNMRIFVPNFKYKL